MAETFKQKSSGSFLTTWKDLVALARDTFLLLLIVLLLVFPTTFNNLLVSAGFEEGSIVGFKWKAKLVESDQALKEARANITDLTTQNEKLARALTDAQTGLEVDPISRTPYCLAEGVLSEQTAYPQAAVSGAIS